MRDVSCVNIERKIKDDQSKVIVYIRFIIRYVVYKISQIFTTLFEPKASTHFIMKIKLSKPLDLHTTGADFTQPLFLKYNLIGSYILASLYMGKSKNE